MSSRLSLLPIIAYHLIAETCRWLLTFWNVFFTSLPVIMFGIFEKVRHGCFYHRCVVA